MDEHLFERIADDEMRYLERELCRLDPDELEVELAHDVLKLTLADGAEIVINSHRAAGQIWMAALRRAWHFTPVEGTDGWRWRTGEDELRSTLRQLLAARLGHTIDL